MSPRRSNRIDRPSGETSRLIQVPSSVVNSTLRAFSGVALMSRFGGFFASAFLSSAFFSSEKGPERSTGRAIRARTRSSHSLVRRIRSMVVRLALRFSSIPWQGVEAADLSTVGRPRLSGKTRGDLDRFHSGCFGFVLFSAAGNVRTQGIPLPSLDLDSIVPTAHLGSDLQSR